MSSPPPFYSSGALRAPLLAKTWAKKATARPRASPPEKRLRFARRMLVFSAVAQWPEALNSLPLNFVLNRWSSLQTSIREQSERFTAGEVADRASSLFSVAFCEEGPAASGASEETR